MTPALAAPPETIQELLEVKLNLKPNRLLPLPAKQITGTVPVSVLTDKSGRIIGLLVQGSNFTYLEKTGDSFIMRSDSAAATMNTLRSKSFELSANVTVRGKISLFHIDATRLDPARGGPLTIKYVSNAFGGQNEVKLELVKRGGTWLAASSKKKAISGPYVRSVVVETGFAGLGFDDAEFRSLDPNEIVRILSPKRLPNPAVATNLMKAGEQTLESFERNPELLGPVTISLSSRKGS
ncbi:MAG: hypothetical protein NDJ90_14940 [Oligoflexia bacterium]|nr:hypothetical protein [Oligoflexia bacterium]